MMPIARLLAATKPMLSMTHMAVLFIVVLVIFGPHKLPELARGLGKLMAEFRKASTDFKSAFEQEMRDIERQALQAERKKAAEAVASASVSADQPATLATQADTQTAPVTLDADSRATEALVVTPVAESVPRFDGDAAHQESVQRDSGQPDSGQQAEAKSVEETPAVSIVQPSRDPSHDPSHDQQQPV
jgi:TatA/E family protein of Tat protein translocase